MSITPVQLKVIPADDLKLLRDAKHKVELADLEKQAASLALSRILVDVAHRNNIDINRNGLDIETGTVYPKTTEAAAPTPG